MTPSKKQVYWDSCVFLSYLNGEQQRADVVEAMLRHNLQPDGEVRIMTSTFTIAEVAASMQERKRMVLDPASEKKITAFWNGGGILLVEYHQLLGHDSRGLIRHFLSERRSLKGKDAVHLASALRYSAVEFHTYDEQLLGIKKLNGMTICLPHLAQPELVFNAP